MSLNRNLIQVSVAKEVAEEMKDVLGMMWDFTSRVLNELKEKVNEEEKNCWVSRCPCSNYIELFTGDVSNVSTQTVEGNGTEEGFPSGVC
jgi:hypothetical protein